MMITVEHEYFLTQLVERGTEINTAKVNIENSTVELNVVCTRELAGYLVAHPQDEEYIAHLISKKVFQFIENTKKWGYIP